MHGGTQQRHMQRSGNFWRIMELPAMLIDMTYNDTPLSRSGQRVRSLECVFIEHAPCRLAIVRTFVTPQAVDYTRDMHVKGPMD